MKVRYGAISTAAWRAEGVIGELKVGDSLVPLCTVPSYYQFGFIVGRIHCERVEFDVLNNFT